VPLLDDGMKAALRRFLFVGAGANFLPQEGTPPVLSVLQQQPRQAAPSHDAVSTKSHVRAFELKGPSDESFDSGKEKQLAIEADTLLMKSGFTSVLAARLAAELQMQISKPVPPILLFEHPTPRSVFNYLNAISSSPVYTSIDQLCRFLVSFRSRVCATLEDSAADSEDSMPSEGLS
jgi:hypothetical protein